MRRLWVLIGLGLAVGGCGSTRVLTHTVTRTDTATITHVITRTVTATRTAPVKASGGTGLRKLYTFSGNGSETVGTITIPAGGATVAWKCDGQFFAFQSQGVAINIVSQASSGQSFVYGGTYPDAQINAQGDWEIVIVTGA